MTSKQLIQRALRFAVVLSRSFEVMAVACLMTAVLPAQMAHATPLAAVDYSDNFDSSWSTGVTLLDPSGGTHQWSVYLGAGGVGPSNQEGLNTKIQSIGGGNNDLVLQYFHVKNAVGSGWSTMAIKSPTFTTTLTQANTFQLSFNVKTLSNTSGAGMYIDFGFYGSGTGTGGTVANGALFGAVAPWASGGGGFTQLGPQGYPGTDAGTTFAGLGGSFAQYTEIGFPTAPGSFALDYNGNLGFTLTGWTAADGTGTPSSTAVWVLPTGTTFSTNSLYLAAATETKPALSANEGFTLDNLEVTSTSSVVPEPSTLGLAALGLAGLGLVAWRRHHKRI